MSKKIKIKFMPKNSNEDWLSEICIGFASLFLSYVQICNSLAIDWTKYFHLGFVDLFVTILFAVIGFVGIVYGIGHFFQGLYWEAKHG